MADPKIIRYLLENAAYPREMLRDALRQAGYSETDILAAEAEADRSNTNLSEPSVPSAPLKPPSAKKKFWFKIIIFGIIPFLTLGGAGAASFFLYFDKPPDIDFSAEPLSIFAGEESLLVWNAKRAKTCEALEGWHGTKAVSGTEKIAPEKVETYVLTCRGWGGESKEIVAVEVQPAPSCSTEPDGKCASWCSIDSDYDCCLGQKNTWVEWQGCFSPDELYAYYFDNDENFQTVIGMIDDVRDSGFFVEQQIEGKYKYWELRYGSDTRFFRCGKIVPTKTFDIGGTHKVAADLGENYIGQRAVAVDVLSNCP